MIPLTSARENVYDAIVRLFEQNSYSPTVREITVASNLKSTSTVHAHLKSLAALGLITWNPKMVRTVTLTGKTPDDLEREAHLAHGDVA